MKDIIMPKTKWYSPNLVAELDQEEEVSFTDGEGILDATSNIISTLPVRGTSTSTRGLITRESNSLLFSNFNLPSIDNITGIEVEVHVTRLARIQDKQIQLYFNKPVGKNLANLDAADITVYGSSQEKWGLQFSNIDFTSNNFGVIVDFQPHTQYPSSNQIYLRSVKILVQYE
jgi:hypothetical protein